MVGSHGVHYVNPYHIVAGAVVVGTKVVVGKVDIGSQDQIDHNFGA